MSSFLATHKLTVLKSNNKSFPTHDEKIIGVGMNPGMQLDIIVLQDMKVGEHPYFRTALFGDMVLDEAIESLAYDPTKGVLYVTTRTCIFRLVEIKYA